MKKAVKKRAKKTVDVRESINIDAFYRLKDIIDLSVYEEQLVNLLVDVRKCKEYLIKIK